MDQSLDEIISRKKERNVSKGGHGGSKRSGGRKGRSRRSGGDDVGSLRSYNPLDRSAPVRNNTHGSRYAPYNRRPARRNTEEGQWKRDLYQSDARSRTSTRGNPKRSTRSFRTKAASSRSCVVEVFNLASQVEGEDLRDIFSEVGEVVKAKIGLTEEGDPDGSASITFSTREEAIEAVDEFDKAKVDGRPMALSLAEPEEEDQEVASPKKRFRIEKRVQKSDDTAPKSKTTRDVQPYRPRGRNNEETKSTIFGSAMDIDDDDAFRSFRGRNGNSGRSRRGGRGGRGGGARGRQRGGNRGNKGGRGGRTSKRKQTEKAPAPTKEDLDAEMDAYMKSAKSQGEE